MLIRTRALRGKDGRLYRNLKDYVTIETDSEAISGSDHRV
jgi:hypothetical protein